MVSRGKNLSCRLMELQVRRWGMHLMKGEPEAYETD